MSVRDGVALAALIVGVALIVAALAQTIVPVLLLGAGLGLILVVAFYYVESREVDVLADHPDERE